MFIVFVDEFRSGTLFFHRDSDDGKVVPFLGTQHKMETPILLEAFLTYPSPVDISVRQFVGVDKGSSNFVVFLGEGIGIFQERFQYTSLTHAHA